MSSYAGVEEGLMEDTLKHSEHEYVNGDVHTNTVGGYFALLKHGIDGTFHHDKRQTPIPVLQRIQLSLEASQDQ